MIARVAFDGVWSRVLDLDIFDLSLLNLLGREIVTLTGYP
jgi:hypothetical protein